MKGHLSNNLSLEKEKELVIEAQKNATEFGKLYDLYVDDIYRYALYRVGNVEDAEDLTALVFEKALKSIRTFEWQGFKFSSWLYRIAHNLIIDSYKKDKDVLSLDDMEIEFEDHDIEDMMTTVSKEFEIKTLMDAITNLNDEQREIVYLRYIKELSIQETIDITGRTIDSVKSLSKRGLARLKEFLSKNG